MTEEPNTAPQASYFPAIITHNVSPHPAGQVTYNNRFLTQAAIEPGSDGAVVAMNVQVDVTGDGTTGQGGHFVGHKSVAVLKGNGRADQVYAAEAAVQITSPGTIGYAANFFSYLQGTAQGAEFETFAHYFIGHPGAQNGRIGTWIGLDNPVLSFPGEGSIGEALFIRNQDPAQRIETTGEVLLKGEAAKLAADGTLRLLTGDTGAVVLGDASNVATGQWAAALGGKDNRVEGLTAGAVGYKHTVSPFGGFAAGIAHTIRPGAAGGSALGQSNIVGGKWSTALGYWAYDFARTGGVVQASGANAAQRIGIPQTTIAATLRGQTSGMEFAVLTTDGEPPGQGNCLNLAPRSTQVMRGLISADMDGLASAAWEISWVIRRGETAASTTVVGMPVITLLASDSALYGARITITADTSEGTGGAPRIMCSGVSDRTLHWAASVHGLDNGG